jgi:RHH-type transcriptional regulator, proline utilization regulon repressor / proline dehydrogenase / delta 1-pyrroline-5-carboxylate dehydrogenase
MKPISLAERVTRLKQAPADDALLANEAVGLAAELLRAGQRAEKPAEKRQGAQMARMMHDPAGKAFTLAMADQVFRPPTAERSASQFRRLLDGYGVPEYLSLPERLAMRAGAAASAVAPDLVMPAITRAMRTQSSAVILPAEDEKLKPLLDRRRDAGMRMNLNQLGEAILGEGEAENRMRAIIARLESPDCNYLSVKLSAIFSQIHLIGHEETLARVTEKLRRLYRAAMANPWEGRPKFVNLDMEEYRDLHLTREAFQTVLDEPEFMQLEAGIVLQAYLPDSWPVQRELISWARERAQRGGAGIKIRIVKGANLAMESVEAELHDWPCAVYPTKEEVDANFKRMLHEGCKKENAEHVRLGVASHNLFDLSYAILLRAREGVEDRVDFEMLEGMANHQARVVHEVAGGLLLYAPVVKHDDFHSAIAYLVRRLDENTADENFLRDLFGMREGDSAWENQKARFLRACERKDSTFHGPRRTQNRATGQPEPLPDLSPFHNEADTDWALPHNVAWIREKVAAWQEPPAPDLPTIPLCIAGAEEPGETEAIGRDPSRPGYEAYRYAQASPAQLERALQTAVDARASWQALGHAGRAKLLRQVAAEIGRMRGDIIATMVLDAGKAAYEADVEVTEAIDFANYYADSLRVPGFDDGSSFTPFGTVVVTPPWNFPFAIPCGGVLAALAAGNTVILKPASATALTGWILARCLWAAGIPREVLQFFTCPGQVGRALLTDPRTGGVVLTGAYETARMFLDWQPEMRLFAETSGKNALIITAAADPDQAVKDLVKSAFGHSGQKCSAASLAIVEAEVYDDPGFRRQLRDAAASLKVGTPWEFDSIVTPCTVPPGEDLMRGLTQLDAGEEWLLEPQMIDGNPQLWSPGIRLGVTPDSWYRRTECFGPVLGLVRARDLDEAIRIQNASEFGLTGGIHSLDDREIETWRESVEVGNAYINRPITGAIVRRQPFGGWKRSCFGPGAKAGGPNYVAQFGTWENIAPPALRLLPAGKAAVLLDKLKQLLPDHAGILAAAAENDAYWDKHEFSLEHDPTAMRCESNHFRYRRFKNALIRATAEVSDAELARLLLAATTIGTPFTLSLDELRPWLAELGISPDIEDDTTLAVRFPSIAADFGLVRAPHGDVALKQAVIAAGQRWADGPVIWNARIEWPAWLREQAVSRTLHRYGNLIPPPERK